MARKTFISYKYSEARGVRDRIIDALDEDAIYYNGERNYSPNRSGDSDDAIWNYLKDMIWGTTVTIVVISPNMNQSDWIPSEISYSLRKVSRDGVQSQRNGVVAVIQKIDGGYGWFKTVSCQADGCTITTYDESKVPKIITENRRNQDPKVYTCDRCKTISALTGSYISFVEEDEFIAKIGTKDDYIERAFEKCSNNCSGYVINVEV